MIGAVLKELGDDVKVVLPQKIQVVADLYSLDLDTDFSYRTWWEAQSDKLVIDFPALALTWDENGTRTGQRDGSGGRVALHRLTLTYSVRSADTEYIRRHMLYVAEAALLWLDQLPSASRAPGTGRTVVGLDRADGNEIQITHGPDELQKGGVFIWSLDVAFTVKAKDQALPART